MDFVVESEDYVDDNYLDVESDMFVLEGLRCICNLIFSDKEFF